MALLTDISFFQGDIEIVNINETGGPTQEVNTYIRQHEPELLSDVLGYELYSVLQASAASNTLDANFQKLVFGNTYTDNNNHLQSWKGIIETDINPYTFGTIQVGYKRSFIANYIYWHWQKSHATFSTGMGEKTVGPSGTIAVSPADKMIKAWNDMSTWIAALWNYLKINSTVFTNWNAPCRDLVDKYKKIPYGF